PVQPAEAARRTIRLAMAFGHAELDPRLPRRGFRRQALANQVVAPRIAMEGQFLVQLAVRRIAARQHLPPLADSTQHGIASSVWVSSTRRMASTRRCQSAVSLFSRARPALVSV